MTKRRLSMLIGGGVAIVALGLLLSTVPIVKGEPRDGVLTSAADNVSNEAGNCAHIAFETRATYTVVRPLVDLWGFAQVVDLQLPNAHVSAATVPACDDGATTELGAMVLVLEPNCADVDVAANYGVTRAEVVCNGRGMAFGLGAEPGQKADLDFIYDDYLAPSGLVRGDQWCLRLDPNLDFGSAGIERADEATGDACLNLS